MIKQKEIEYLCDKYYLKRPKCFESTGYAVIDSGLDEWLIVYVEGKERPYCLKHKNKLKDRNKYHTQRYLRTLNQLFDCIVKHKGAILYKIASQNTYKNTNIKNKKRRNYYC